LFTERRDENMSLPLNQIVCGDCLEVMKEFPDESIGCVVTDPPYNTQRKLSKPFRDKAKTRLSEGEWFIYNDMSERVYLIKLKVIIKELYRILKPSAHLYIFTDWKTLRNLMDILEFSHFCLNDLLVWNKKHFGIGFYYRPQVEFILFTSKGRAKKMTKHNIPNIFSVARLSNSHILTEKPVSIINELILNSTSKGDLVLDPFVGSGTTCVASQKLGRKWIGIDINPEYVEMAKKRLRRECSQKLTKFVEVVE